MTIELAIDLRTCGLGIALAVPECCWLHLQVLLGPLSLIITIGHQDDDES